LHMRFPSLLVEGRLIRRYKRFLADIELAGGGMVTAHCANPGSMLGLDAPQGRVFVSRSDKAGRKLAHSWEIVEADFGWKGPQLVAINTLNPNRLAGEAIAAGLVPALAGYDRMQREVKYGRASRVDFVLSGAGRRTCYVEVKNVHLMRQPGLAEFPDSVTARGARHLDELGAMAEQGMRAVMLFVVQMEAERFSLAGEIDPAYQAAFAQAARRGVEAHVAVCRVTLDGVAITGTIPFEA
jgi:sugar fermentation stimulation protein A